MKLSLRALFGWVALAALMVAALAQPSLLWMRVMFTLALGFVACAAAGAILLRGKPRAFWTGAAMCGGLYLFILLHLHQGEIRWRTVLARGLLTQHLLDAIARARGMPIRSEFDGFELWEDAIFRPESPSGVFYGGPGGGGMGGGFGGGGFMAPGSGMPGMPVTGTTSAPPPGGAGDEAESDSTIDPPDGGSPATGGDAADVGMASGGDDPAGMGSAGYSGAMGPVTGPPVPAVAVWTWPYAAYNHFVLSGHCAFVILVGLAGGALVRALFGRDESSS